MNARTRLFPIGLAGVDLHTKPLVGIAKLDFENIAIKDDGNSGMRIPATPWLRRDSRSGGARRCFRGGIVLGLAGNADARQVAAINIPSRVRAGV